MSNPVLKSRSLLLTSWFPSKTRLTVTINRPTCFVGSMLDPCGSSVEQMASGLNRPNYHFIQILRIAWGSMSLSPLTEIRWLAPTLVSMDAREMFGLGKEVISIG